MFVVQVRLEVVGLDMLVVQVRLEVVDLNISVGVEGTESTVGAEGMESTVEEEGMESTVEEEDIVERMVDFDMMVEVDTDILHMEPDEEQVVVGSNLHHNYIELLAL